MIWRFIDRIGIWHIALCCAVVYACSLSAFLSLNGDDSTYILLSRSLLHRDVLHEGLLPKEAAGSGIYYFMLPLLLIPFSAFAGANYLLMKAIPLASAVGSVLCLNVLLKDAVSQRQRKIILILFAFNPWVTEYSGMILTEMPYLFLMLLSLVMFDRYEKSGGAATLASSALFSGMALYTRPAGIILYFAMLVFLVMKRRFMGLAVMLVVLAILLTPMISHMPDAASSFFKNL